MKQDLSLVWDLDSFFPGGSQSPEFIAYLDRLDKDIVALHNKIQSAAAPESAEEAADFISIVEVVQDLDSRVRQSIAFTECLIAQDVKDDKAKLLYGRVIQLSSSYSSVLIGLDQYILQIPGSVWDTILTDPAIQPVAFPLHERRIRAQEKLSPEQEVLANDLAVDGYHAWSELYGSIVGRINIPYETAGDVQELSVGQAANMMNSPDRATRSSVFAKWEAAWDAESEIIGHTLNHLGGFRVNLYRHRGWDSILKEPLDINRMTEETLMTMWQVIEQNKQPLVDYLNRKAKLLGLDKLSWYDVHAPLGSAAKHISYQAGAETIVQQFRKFSPKMADFAVKAFEESWIEAEDRPGKRPGGFSTGFADSKQTRIFMTYAGTSDNVSTLAHELGHSYHDYVMTDMPPLAMNYAMNVAETASTFAEMVVADAAVKNAASDEERVLLLEEKAQNAVSFMMNIHARFIFERNFYDRRKQGLLSVEELNELMLQAQKTAFQDALADYHPLFWASKLHFYATDVPFYNFPYTFGYLFSYGVYARALQEGPAFEDKYIGLLRDTGSMTVEELADKHLGVDLRKPDFWESAVKLAIGDVQEFLRVTE